MTPYPSCRLSDCCVIKPPKSEARKLLKPDELVSFVPMENLGINSKALTLEKTRKLADVSSSYTFFADNDVLLAKITPCFENGKLGIANGLKNSVGFGSSEFIVLRPKDNLTPEYLYYFLVQPSFRTRGKAVMTGAVGHRRVPKEFIESTEIPLPSIPEQQRIVAILDQAFADIEKARANAEQNLKNARELFDSYLQQVFSQRGEGWQVRPLESFSSIVNGFAFKSGDFSPNNKVKSIKITNVGVYSFIEECNNYLPQNYVEKYDNYRAFEGDIVVALTRTIISSGLKVAVVPSSYNTALVNQRVAAVQVDEDVMPREMLRAFLSTSIAINYVKSNVSELMQPNLSIKDLKAFPIPVPPPGKKLSISKNIDKIKHQTDQLVEIYISKIEALNELKKSLLQKAFSGELTKGKGIAA